MSRKLRSVCMLGCAAAFLVTSAPALAGTNLDAARNLVNKGNYLMASGHFAEALKTYEDAQKFEPSNVIIKDNIAKVYNNWAISLTKAKDYRGALEKLQKCLDVWPGYGQARANMALLKRVAQEDGVDLDAPPDAPETAGAASPKLPDGGWLPGHEPQSAAGATTSGATAIAPKVAPVRPDAGAVLFIGGQKVEPNEPPAALPVTNEPAPTFVEPSLPASAPTKADAGPATFVQKNVNPMFPVTPQQFPNDAVHATPPASASANLVPGTKPPPAVPPVSFDDQLTAVEMKVYGSKQQNLTVLQRLEKIERDSQGQIRSGTILERIDYLKKAYGL